MVSDFETMDLPENVVLEILLRLPVRSVVRFRCVCKGWCALIKSSIFKDKHLSLKHASAVGDDVIVFQVTLSSGDDNGIYWSFLNCYDYESIPIYYPDEPSSNDFDVTSYFPIEFINNFSFRNSFINHVNGIICIVEWVLGEVQGNCHSIILLNPSIREIRKVPVPDLGFKYCTEGLGLGFDDATNEYKVVGVVTVVEEGCYHKHIGIVYHLSKNSWNILGEISPIFCEEDSKSNSYYHLHIGFRTCTFSHGSVHWLMSPSDSTLLSRILTFNMTSELFQVIEFPHVLEEDYGYATGISLFSTLEQSTITLVAFKSTCVCDIYTILDVWVMKEYGIVESWTKLYSLNPFPEKITEAFCLWKKNQLFFQTEHHELICYDLSKDEVYRQRFMGGAEMITCIESFVSVKL